MRYTPLPEETDRIIFLETGFELILSPNQLDQRFFRNSIASHLRDQKGM